MKHPSILDALIIGGGPAGIAAAIWCKRLGLNTLIIEKERELGGQLHHIYNQIIDYPGLITKNGEELTQHLVDHLQFLEIPTIINEEVTKIIRGNRDYVVKTKQSSFTTKSVILATGATERRLNIPGEQEMIKRGETYSSKRDIPKLKGKRIMIVGGGDRAFEGVCNLADTADKILLIHRSDRFRARHELIARAKQYSNVEFLSSTIVEAIYGEQKVEAASILNRNTQISRLLPVDAVLIRIGVRPIDQLAPPEVERNESGNLIVDEDGKTTLTSFFAIGDVINYSNSSSISVCVGQGMRAAKSLLNYMDSQRIGEL